MYARHVVPVGLAALLCAGCPTQTDTVAEQRNPCGPGYVNAGNGVCCPESTPINAGNGVCCPADAPINAGGVCCPSHAPVYAGSGVCCPLATPVLDALGRCVAENPSPVLPPGATGVLLSGDNGFGCNFICVVFPTDVFCDSDCDGWYDAVEIRFGDNPCNSLSPPYAPSSPATVCSDILGLAKSRETASLELLQQERSTQVQELAATTADGSNRP